MRIHTQTRAAVIVITTAALLTLLLCLLLSPLPCRAQSTTYGSGTGSGHTTTSSRSSPVTGSLSVISSQPSIDNVYCPPSGIPSWPATDGPATLPTACWNTSSANTPASGSTINVSTASQLTTAAASAVCGQHIVLAAGASFAGTFTFNQSCPTTNYLWVQTSGLSSLPPEGTRTSPCYSGVTSLPGRPVYLCPVIPGTYTAQLETTGINPTVEFGASASGIRFVGLEFSRTTGTAEIQSIIGTENSGTLTNILFDRIWCHGVESGTGNPGYETKHCLSGSAVSYLALIDSYLDDFYCVSTSGACTDSQAIGCGTNATNSTIESVIKVVNNYLEAAGEGIICGGGIANTTPTNGEIRHNTLIKPLSWNPSDPSYNGGVSGNPLIVKNCIEFKNATQFFIEGNYCANIWAGFSQDGAAFLVDPKSQANGGSGSLCTNCYVTHITERYNFATKTCLFGQFDNIADDNGGFASGGNNWSIHDNVAEDLNDPDLYDCQSSSSLMELDEAYNVPSTDVLHDVTVNHNTMVDSGSSIITRSASFGTSGQLISSGLQMYNITYTNNAFERWGTGTANNGAGASDPNPTNNCAYLQTGGSPMITNCWSPLTFGGNCIVNNAAITWPGTNVTSVASLSALFTNYNNGLNGTYIVAPGSACKGAGTDGLDPGANISLVSSYTLGALP